MKKKKKIALFFGGLSNEFEVTIMSSKNVIANFDYRKYDLILMYWHKSDGCFYRVKDINDLKVLKKDKIHIRDFKKHFDIALLMTHGRYGEDGVLQALLQSQKMKYCGCRVLSSALCMDKAVFKDILKSQNISQVNYLVLDYKKERKQELETKEKIIKKDFKLPIYIKPANSGSSVGISRIEKWKDLEKGIKKALKHDFKILIEQGLVSAREFEVAVLGNDKLIISEPGELGLAKDFYDYDDKYKLDKTEFIVPAKLESKKKKEIKDISKRAYQLCNCQGFARIDFLMSKNKIYLNEINTLPGFTNISMFPKLMRDKGLSDKEIINKIISLAY